MTEERAHAVPKNDWRSMLIAVVYEQGGVVPISQAVLQRAMRDELVLTYAMDDGALILSARAVPK